MTRERNELPEQNAAAAKRGPRLSRRGFLLGGTLVGGALVVGYIATHPMEVVGNLMSLGGTGPEPSAFGPFIRIDADGSVTIVNKQQEMGQGIHAGLAAMIAEELDADWDKVRVVSASGNLRAYGPQMVGGSNSIASNWDAMRNAGAAARMMFVAAAAERWKASKSEIAVRDGILSHNQSNQQLSFAELLSDAARQTPPQTPELKQPKDYRLVGTDRVRRKDSAAKSDGSQIYTQDVYLPQMLTAMVAHAPRFGSKLARFDAAHALKIKGVVDVFAIETGVAVVAEDTFAARKGRDALIIEWDDSAAETRSSSDLQLHYREIAEGRTDVSSSNFQTLGDARAPLKSGALDISFDFPYLAHAPMEPLNCVARIDGSGVKILSGTQHVTIDQIQAALVALTLPGKVDIEVLASGGSFGRRSGMASDYFVECLRIAKRTKGRPVKLIWTREDEMSAGYYRPMTHHRVWIELNAQGFPERWRHHIVSQSLLPVGENTFAVEGVHESPYFAMASTVEGKVYSPRLPVPVAFWRSVGHSHTGLVMEHIADQLARRAGRDPADYRRQLFEKAGATRHIAVLEEVCRRAGWLTPLEPGWARGLAVHESFGTVVGQVAEVTLESGRPRVRRVVGVVDCGIAVSPDQIAAQMEGGIGFGLSAALYGAVTLKDGIVQETNFDRYQILRINEMPTVETHILPSTNRPTGMGEPGVSAIAAAVANAMLSLTGAPTTRLPLVSRAKGVDSRSAGLRWSTA